MQKTFIITIFAFVGCTAGTEVFGDKTNESKNMDLNGKITSEYEPDLGSGGNSAVSVVTTTSEVSSNTNVSSSSGGVNCGCTQPNCLSCEEAWHCCVWLACKPLPANSSAWQDCLEGCRINYLDCCSPDNSCKN